MGGAPAAPLQKNSKSELHVDRSDGDNQLTCNEFVMLNAELLPKVSDTSGQGGRDGPCLLLPTGTPAHTGGPECEEDLTVQAAAAPAGARQALARHSPGAAACSCVHIFA